MIFEPSIKKLLCTKCEALTKYNELKKESENKIKELQDKLYSLGRLITDITNGKKKANDYCHSITGNNLVSPICYLEQNFEKTSEGYIVYKSFGENYEPPKEWVIKEGSVIKDIPDFDRYNPCGRGINVGTKNYVVKNSKKEIWKCLIRWEWLPGVCVPYNTDGKIRCERLELLKQEKDPKLISTENLKSRFKELIIQELVAIGKANTKFYQLEEIKDIRKMITDYVEKEVENPRLEKLLKTVKIFIAYKLPNLQSAHRKHFWDSNFENQEKKV